MTAIARRTFAVALATAALLTQWTGTAQAQTLGTFTFQLQPYCNVITMTITQEGATYRLSGWDDACGASQHYPMSGTIIANPNGTLAFAFVVTRPNGIAVDTNFTFTPVPPYSGPWSDSAGNTGTFVLGGAAAGSPRPAPASSVPVNSVNTTNIIDNSITAIDVDPTQVQLRVSGTCAAGQSIRSINSNGTVVCGAGATTLFDEQDGLVNALTNTCEDLTSIAFGTVAAGTLTCTGSVHTVVNHTTGGSASIVEFDVATTAAACPGARASILDLPGGYPTVAGQDFTTPVQRSFTVPAGALTVYVNAKTTNAPTINALGHSISCTFTPQ